MSLTTQYFINKRMAILTHKDSFAGKFEMVNDLRIRKLYLQVNRVIFVSTFKRIIRDILNGLN